MNKRGDAIPALVDFFSMLGFLAFILVMIILFKFSHTGFNRDITSAFDESSGFVTLDNMLKMELNYKGQPTTFGALIAFYAASGMREDYLAIKGNLTEYSHNLRAYNVKLRTSGAGSFEVGGTGFTCASRSGKALIPPVTPGAEGIVVELEYCENE